MPDARSRPRAKRGGWIDLYFAPNWVQHDAPSNAGADRDALKQVLEVIRGGFPDVRTRIDMILAERPRRVPRHDRGHAHEGVLRRGTDREARHPPPDGHRPDSRRENRRELVRDLRAGLPLPADREGAAGRGRDKVTPGVRRGSPTDPLTGR